MGRLSRRLERETWELVHRTQSRSFKTALAVDPGAPAVLLSPHLDDAAVDCWSVLSGDAPVSVVNVFTGVPARGTLVHWDRLCGARDSAELMELRLAEDREALARAGHEAIGLGILPDPYRRPRQTPTVGRLDAALTAEVPAASRVLAPAALGTVHPDHLIVRAYALALAEQGIPVELYADVPYAVVFGWPAWVTGTPADPHLDPEVHWRGGRADLPHLLTRERARVVSLSDDDARDKLAAMRTYRTQFPMLDRGPIGQLSNRLIHGHEVFWPVGG